MSGVLRIRPFTAADAAVLPSWLDGPGELRLWAGDAFRWPLDPPQLARYRAESETGSRRTWSAVEGDPERLVGHCSLLVTPDGRRGRLGRVLVAPRERHGGRGAAMLRGVLAEAFDGLGLTEVELGVYTRNTAALALYERLGFTPPADPAPDPPAPPDPWSVTTLTLRSPPRPDLPR
ncbi:GNAT family protein [Kitasatospora saccharophila]|uniref:GNAT family protein n=1 Tax=Kitasatospora saccharophila TaxID=407973 RepID=A0ABN2XAZ0_9ACTN